MTRITKPKRSKVGAKRLDLTDMRAAFADRRTWTAVGIVECPEGVAQHWEVVTEDGEAVDVLIEVVLQPSQQPVTARLRAGWWEVPALGDEVAIIMPEGALDFMPIVVCKLSSNHVPTVQGPQPGRIVIESDEVLVHDGNGGAVSLATHASHQATVSKLNDLITKYIAHIHGGGTISGSTAIPDDVEIAPDLSADGTDVLKGK